MANELDLHRPIMEIERWTPLLDAPHRVTAWLDVIPKGSTLTPQALKQQVLLSFAKNPDILQCSPLSILESVSNCAACGLELGTVRGHGYLVPFRGKCVFMPGYRGLAALAMRSGIVAAMEADYVAVGEPFKLLRSVVLPGEASEPCLVHEISLGDRPIATAIGAYAIARMNGGHDAFKWVTAKSIHAIKRSALDKFPGSPWGKPDWEGEMWCKTAVRAICKLLPDDTLPPAIHKIWAEEDKAFGPSFDEERIADNTKASADGLASELEAAMSGGGGKAEGDAKRAHCAPAIKPIDATPAPVTDAKAFKIDGFTEARSKIGWLTLADELEFSADAADQKRAEKIRKALKGEKP